MSEETTVIRRGRPPKQQQQESVQQGVDMPGLIMKGTRKSIHHLFKSDIQKMKKNVSYKKGAPKIEEFDHTHQFHSINSQMKEQQYTSTVGGHFHKIEMKIVDGKPTVTHCGPPMIYKPQRLVSGGTRRVLSPQKWVDVDSGRDLIDNHTHVMNYVYSEEISEQQVRSIQQDNFQTTAKAIGLEERDAAGD